MRGESKTKSKMSLVDKRCIKVSSECGRMKYLGVDMAFISIRGKRMLTMSEVARKLYPDWPRTTLSDRMKQLSIPRHTCTPNEIKKIHSVNGVMKIGINCTLISKDDLDAFCRVYEVQVFGKCIGSCQDNSLTALGGQINAKKEQGVKLGTKQGKLGRLKTIDFGREHGRKPFGGIEKTCVKDKRVTRVVVKGLKKAKMSVHKGHAVAGVNNVVSKQLHVLKRGRSHDIKEQSPLKSPVKGNINIIRKRKLSGIKTEFANIAAKRNRKNTTRLEGQHKRRDTSSPASDCNSYDSGISSLGANPQIKSFKKIKKADDKSCAKSKKLNYKDQLKTKYVNGQRNGKRSQNGKLSNNSIGLKKKGTEILTTASKGGRGVGLKRTKLSQSCNKNSLNTITKEFIMKMDLKHMNDKELIHSFSPISTPITTPKCTPSSKESPYQVKLMPVKPVWRVNSSFKFISNFLLPPSLVVENGELKPACSMVCNPGHRPPTAHPIWKWKVGKPVVGNKTEISYRMKKVKCVDG